MLKRYSVPIIGIVVWAVSILTGRALNYYGLITFSAFWALIVFISIRPKDKINCLISAAFIAACLISCVYIILIIYTYLSTKIVPGLIT